MPTSFLRSAVLLMVLGLAGLQAAEGPPKPGSTPPGRVSFRTYGSTQGLGNLATNVLLQDTLGFLWVGTEDGLYRYDGQRFQNFGMKEGLPSSFINALHQDGSGRLWAGTYQGLGLWTGRGFRPVGQAEGLPMESVLGLSSKVGGPLWVALATGPFVQDDQGRFKSVSGWPGGEATAVLCDERSHRVWMAGWGPEGARLHEFDRGIWRVLQAPTGFEKERLDALLVDREGNLWARGQRRLWVKAAGAAGFVDALPDIPLVSARAALSQDRSGRVLVPTDKGICIREGQDWRRLAQKDGLPTAWARWALEDQEGSLWVASLGVHRLLGRGLWRAYTSGEGLPNEMVWTVARDRGGAFLMGSDQGALRASAQGWSTLEGTAGNVIRTIQEAPDGTLYMSGVPVEVLRWNPRTRQVDARFGAEAGLTGKRLFRLVLDGQGLLWAATEGAGLMRADTRRAKLEFEPIVMPGGHPKEYVSGITLGASGRFWACGDRGLGLLEHGKWRRFTSQDGLLRTHVAYCLELKNGDLLVAYFEAQGFSRVRVEGGKLKVLEHPASANPIGREKIYMLGEDAKGRIWVGTGQGLFVFQGDRMEHFGLSEGLVGEDISNMAFLSDAGGDVWIGTSAGLARFDAAAYQGQPKPPSTVFLDARLGNEVFDPESPPKVPHARRTFEVTIAGISFLGEGTLQHQVRLEPLEDDWHLTHTREARFPALSPGAYTFRARSRVGEGEWGPETTLRFTVLPAWWQSAWFRTLVGLAILGILVVVGRWRMRALREQNRELEALVHARTRELEVANEALRAQSLTDPLTGLKNRRYLGVCMPEDVAQVQRNHRAVAGSQAERLALNIDLVLIMVDVDHFKSINDHHGHHAGDLVLQQLADILRSATRDTDTVVRWGGEEFLVVARNACRKDAVILVERIRALVEAHAFAIGEGQILHRTCSLGFAYFPFLPTKPDHLPWETVVDVADHGLYAAKRAGRNGWVGLVPDVDGKPEPFQGAWLFNLPGLLHQKDLKVLSSFPEDTVFEWDVKG